MPSLTKEDADNLVEEYVENRTLEDLLEELKMYGKVVIYYSHRSWHCEFHPKIRKKEYKYENSGKDLTQLVKYCMSFVYISQVLNKP